MNGTCPLFIQGAVPECESMNMFVQADPVPAVTSTANFIITGGNTSKGAFSAIPLFIIGETLNSPMNLFIAGKDSGGLSKIMRFFINGVNPSMDGSAPLYIENQMSLVTGETSLFIQGFGTNAGYIPDSGSIGLFIKRGPYMGTTLFIQNNDVAGLCALFIRGAPEINNFTPLFIDGYGEMVEGDISLFIDGNIPTSLSHSTTLIIPNVVGFTPSSAALYINGFKY